MDKIILVSRQKNSLLKSRFSPDKTKLSLSCCFHIEPLNFVQARLHAAAKETGVREPSRDISNTARPSSQTTVIVQNMITPNKKSITKNSSFTACETRSGSPKEFALRNFKVFLTKLLVGEQNSWLLGKQLSLACNHTWGLCHRI